MGVHQPAGTADKTTMGLSDRLLEGHSARPVGSLTADDWARPTDHYQDSPETERQPATLGQTWSRHPLRTVLPATPTVVDQQHTAIIVAGSWGARSRHCQPADRPIFAQLGFRGRPSGEPGS